MGSVHKMIQLKEQQQYHSFSYQSLIHTGPLSCSPWSDMDVSVGYEVWYGKSHDIFYISMDKDHTRTNTLKYEIKQNSRDRKMQMKEEKK